MAPPTATSKYLSEIPERILRNSREGFSFAASLPVDGRKQLLSDVEVAIQDGTADLKQLAKFSTISQDQSSALITALTILVSALTQADDPPSEFLTHGRGTAFSATDEPVVAAFASEIAANRAKWKHAIEYRSITAETLPSLTMFDVSVDLRFRFKEDEITDAAAVAIVHLDTDVNNREIWFQLTKGDIQMIIEKLGQTQKKMQAAEQTYTERRSK